MFLRDIYTANVEHVAGYSLSVHEFYPGKMSSENYVPSGMRD